jgi:trans-aconitate methyltransferase
MKRLLEPELMEDESQVIAYSEADFEIPHNEFIQRLKAFVNNPEFCGTALDLGCGPGDISCRFARAFPLSRIDAVDGSKPMIARARSVLPAALEARINFIHGLLPHVILPQSSYEIIFSNSVLHHLPDPQALWQTIKKYSRPGTRIVIMDLFRPGCVEDAQAMVQTYAVNEPEILQRDFYHSLLAAFSIEEINTQLAQADLNLNVEQISDRHVFITGIAT